MPDRTPTGGAAPLPWRGRALVLLSIGTLANSAAIVVLLGIIKGWW